MNLKNTKLIMDFGTEQIREKILKLFPFSRKYSGSGLNWEIYLVIDIINSILYNFFPRAKLMTGKKVLKS